MVQSDPEVLFNNFNKGVSRMVSVLLSVRFAWCLMFDVNATNETFYVSNTHLNVYLLFVSSLLHPGPVCILRFLAFP